MSSIARKSEESQKLSGQIKEFLEGGGVITDIDSTMSPRPKTTVVQARDSYNDRKKQAADEQVEVWKHRSAALHAEGVSFENIAKELNIPVSIVKRGIYAMRLCPSRGTGRAVTIKQLDAMKYIESKGGTLAEAAKHSKLSLTRAKTAAKEYGFYYRRPGE